MVDARASAACATAAARSGAYRPWRGPTGIGWRFPRLLRVMNLPLSGRQRAVWSSKQSGAERRVTSIISKGSEFALSTTAAKSTPGGIQAANPGGVETAGTTLFPVIIELLRRING